MAPESHATLRQALLRQVRGGNLPHAVLLEGERGSGREELAVWLSAALFCRGVEAPCGVCPACRKVFGGSHPDVERIGGEGGARSFHIDKIRALKSGLWLLPNEAGERVYILRDVQDMTQEAQNALLKSLEEPPPFVRFFLTCQNRAQLLETIVSRAVCYRLENDEPALCAEKLRKSFPQASGGDCALSALAFDGNFGAARDALEKPELLAPAILAREALCLSSAGKSYSLLAKLAGEAPDKAAWEEFLTRLRLLGARAALAAHRPAEAALLRQAGVMPLTAARAARLLETIEEANAALRQNGIPELVGSWFCGELAGVFGGNL